MPSIVRATCPPSIVLGRPFRVELAVQAMPGVVALRFELDADSPYMLRTHGEPATGIVCNRSVDSAAEQTVRVELQVVRRPITDSSPTLTLTVSGVEGSSAMRIPLTIA